MRKFSLLFLLCLCCTAALAQFSGGGSGTEKDPYQVTNADQLFEVRNDLAGYYKLMNDIDLTDWIAEDNPKQGWNPIGNESKPFTGNFNGNNKTIKGLYSNRPEMDNVGLFGYISSGAVIHNIALLNPSIEGKEKVGAFVGQLYGDANVYNCIAIKGTIKGNTYIGGICGFIDKDSSSPKELYRCFCSSNIVGIDYCGGMCGGNNNYTRTINIHDNCFCGNVEAKGSFVAGIYGFESSSSYILDIKRNICSGNIKGQNYVTGIATLNFSTATFENNVFCGDTIYSSSDVPCRITNVNDFLNNYAYSGTVVFSKGKQTTVEDNAQNGTSYGLKTLKRRTTYEGLGFDFSNQWAIVEGETFPYNINQCAPAKVSSFVSGSKGEISGSASGTGKVYIIKEGIVYETPIVDNVWTATIGTVKPGETADVIAHIDGSMPSISTVAKAEQGTDVPDITIGDANGDGTFDAADVVAIINYIIGNASINFVEKNADINGDGQVLIDDATMAAQQIIEVQ